MCIYEKNPNAIFKETPEGELLLILLDNDDFYLKIDGFAATMWRIIDETSDRLGEISLTGIQKKCLDSYELPEDQFKKDSQDFFDKIIKLNLIEKK